MPYADLSLLVLRLADQAPDPEDVTAGWTAFAVFALLAAAVVVLGFSLSKHLRKAEAARKAGVFDVADDRDVDPPGRPDGSDRS